jgi:DNA polymerase (family 10)
MSLFSEMADIIEILDGNRFRINAFRKVARVIKETPHDIRQLVQADALNKLVGVGKGSHAIIKTFIETGRCPDHTDLLTEIPSGLLDILKIPGLGPKGVALVWRQLAVETIADLVACIESGAFVKLPRQGKKKAQTILKGIAFLAQSSGRVRLDQALAVCEAVMSQLLACEAVVSVQYAGSLRRGKETIGDIDLLAKVNNPQAVASYFSQMDGVEDVLLQGEKKAAIRYCKSEICAASIQIDLRLFASDAEIGGALQYFTGSQSHNVALREIAVKQNLKLNEYGLFDGETVIAATSEAEIYKALSLAYVPPELREDRGELSLAGSHQLPQLVLQSHILGDMHMHTVASDGKHTLAEMVAHAKGLGYQYIAITDHSQSSVLPNGLNEERLLAQIEMIKAFNKTEADFVVFAGSEVDILADGSLDFADEILAQLDFVTASIHSGMSGDPHKNTMRTLKAMENRYVHSISHPTGRLINKRAAMDLDMAEIFRQAVATNTAMEINASPHRLDLKDTHCQLAVEMGVNIMINTDAHHREGMAQISFGIATARRGHVTKAQVVNTGTITEMKAFLKR